MENLQSIMSHKRIIVHATLMGGQHLSTLLLKLHIAKLYFSFQTHAFDVDFAPVVQRGDGAVK